MLFIHYKYANILFTTNFLKSSMSLVNLRLFKRRKGERLIVFSKAKAFMLLNRHYTLDLTARRFNLLYLMYFLRLKRYLNFFEKTYVLNSYLRSFLLLEFYLEDFFFFKRAAILTSSNLVEFKKLQKVLWQNRFFFLTCISQKMFLRNYIAGTNLYFNYYFLYSQWLNIDFFSDSTNIKELTFFKTFFFFKFYWGFLVSTFFKTKHSNLFFASQLKNVFFYHQIYSLYLLYTHIN